VVQLRIPVIVTDGGVALFDFNWLSFSAPVFLLVLTRFGLSQ